MSAFKRGKNGNRSIYVPTRAGGLVQRSTGTSVPSVVRGMERMVQAFKDEHRWAILDALTVPIVIAGKTRKQFRLSLSRAYDFYASNRLADLEGELSAKNLADYLDGWIKWCRKERRDDVDTPDVYWQQVTTLVEPKIVVLPDGTTRPGVPFLAHMLTKARVKEWLSSREKASSGTLRKYFYALRSFILYLVDEGVYPENPLGDMKAPKKNPARERWETIEVDERIVKNASLKYRAFFAFIKATGADVSSARRALIDDVNIFVKTTTIRGTKTPNRKVIGAAIEPWALPYIRAQLAARQKANDGPLLFPGIDRKPPAQHHDRVCAKLGIADYWLKDARHSVGVRMRLAGRTFEEIAAQLGTSVYHVVTVYAKYKPEQVEQAAAK